jgi:arylsulfatase A-like enzyme
LVNWPGRLPAGTVEGLVSVTDWLPTLVHLAGSQVPPSLRLDGIDIWPLLEGRSLGDERSIYFSIHNEWFCLRGPEWKLIETRRASRQSVELFHLATDPYESRNVASENVDIVDRMRSEIDRCRETDGSSRRPDVKTTNGL